MTQPKKLKVTNSMIRLRSVVKMQQANVGKDRNPDLAVTLSKSTTQKVKVLLKKKPATAAKYPNLEVKPGPKPASYQSVLMNSIESTQSQNLKSLLAEKQITAIKRHKNLTKSLSFASIHIEDQQSSIEEFLAKSQIQTTPYFQIKTKIDLMSKNRKLLTRNQSDSKLVSRISLNGQSKLPPVSRVLPHTGALGATVGKVHHRLW